MRFTHETHGQRVRFASGEAVDAVVAEVLELGAQRVMLVAGGSGHEVADRIAAGLTAAGTAVAHRHHEVVRHVPVEVAERARRAAADAGADLLVSVGGGSATGLAKAVSLTTGLPVVAVPTTYAGSEATDVWGLTEAGRKTTGVDARVLPRVVVYDATLTLALPVELSVASGLNALAHCVDSLWAPRADPHDPVAAGLATEGARALAAGLPRLVADPQNLAGREQTLYGAHLGAVAFASAGSGLHHKICHVLGGRFDLPHAPTHAVVLPHVLALNAPHAPDAERRLAGALGAATAVEGLRTLRQTTRAPRALADLGLTADDVPGAVEAILPVVPPTNPAPVTADALTALLHAALEGREPG